MDALRLLVVAIDHGGYAAFTTQCTGGSLASPVARLGRQRQRIAHRISPKSLGLNIRPFHASRDDHEKGCARVRSEEHKSELQSLMRISYAVFCLKKKIQNKHNTDAQQHSTTQQCTK